MKLYCASFNFSENKCSLAQNKQVQWRLEKRVMSHVPCWPFHTDGPRWLPYSASAASLFCLHATKASWGLQIHTTKSCLQRLHQRRVCACEAPHPPSLWNNWTSNWKDHGVVFFFSYCYKPVHLHAATFCRGANYNHWKQCQSTAMSLNNR